MVVNEAKNIYDNSNTFKVFLLVLILTVGGFSGYIGQLVHLPGWACGMLSNFLLIGVLLHFYNRVDY